MRKYDFNTTICVRMCLHADPRGLTDKTFLQTIDTVRGWHGGVCVATAE